MSFKIEYSEKMIVTTFSGEIIGTHIRGSFTELAEYGNVKDLNHLIFDYTNITSFTTTANLVQTIKIYTNFSIAWNKNINVIVVTTNTNLTTAMIEIIKHNKELVWNYMLFDNLNDALKWCDENE